MNLRIICFLIAALSFLSATRSTFAQPIFKNLPAGHVSIMAGGIPIIYTDQGEGEPLLILTPYRFSTAIWNDLTVRLSRSMRVIVAEPPGLRSPASMNGDFSDIRLLEIYRDLVKAMGLFQVHVMGVGESGMEAAGFGHHWPNLTKSMISINGLETAKWSEPLRTMLDLLQQAGSGNESKLTPVLSLRWHDQPLSREETVRLFVPFRFGTHGAFDTRMEAYRDSLQSAFVPTMMPHLNKPILLIRSKQDRFITEEYINRARRIIPESLIQYEVIADAGHFAFVDQPEKLAELIRDFVGRHRQSRID